MAHSACQPLIQFTSPFPIKCLSCHSQTHVSQFWWILSLASIASSVDFLFLGGGRGPWEVRLAVSTIKPFRPLAEYFGWREPGSLAAGGFAETKSLRNIFSNSNMLKGSLCAIEPLPSTARGPWSWKISQGQGSWIPSPSPPFPPYPPPQVVQPGMVTPL